jgi:hypothetical protein
MKCIFPAIAALSVVAASISAPAAARSNSYKVYTYQLTDDKFSPLLSFVGLPASVNPFGGTFRLWQLRTWIDKQSHKVSHQLYVTTRYMGSWRFYEAAADDGANELPLVKIASDVEDCAGGCSLVETFGIDIPDATLRTKALTGFQIKVSAKSGDSLILDVTPAQIQSELVTTNQALVPDKRWSENAPFGSSPTPDKQPPAASAAPLTPSPNR